MKIEDMLIGEDFTILQTLQQLDVTARKVLFVVREGKLVAAVTDGDVRRWILSNGSLDAPVQCAANYHPKFIMEREEKHAASYMEEYEVEALPVLNEKHEIIRICFKNKKTEKIRTDELANIPVVIMAGGLGTRLYPYTKILPKPLIPVGDVPIIERIINRFLEYGTNNFYLTVNYKKGMIKSYFDELQPDYHVIYVEEEKPLGTGGSLRLITDTFETPFFVTNCDILIDANYAHIYKQHLESENAVTIVSSLKTLVVPYGVLQVGEQGVVCGMEEKPSITHFINTGMYIINPELINMIPENTFYHMPQLVENVMKHGLKVGMYPISEDAFLDMGELEEMERMEDKLRD